MRPDLVDPARCNLRLCVPRGVQATTGSAHPVEKWAPGFKNTGIHRLYSCWVRRSDFDVSRMTRSAQN
jgi:hypothetical protein